MKFCVDSKKYFESLTNAEDREKFLKFFRKRTFEQMPFLWTSIWEEMTDSQRGAIWLDFTKISGLLYCDKEDVYAECLRAEQLRHIWITEYEYGLPDNRKQGIRFRTLSELTKEEMTNAIPQIRDFLKSLVDQAYQKNVIIYWSNIKNFKEHKPDYEFLSP